VAEFGGLSVAGWLVQALTAPLAILVDAVSFVVSAVSVGMIRAREAAPMQNEHPSPCQGIAAGFQALWGEPWLRTSAAALAVQSLSGGMYGALVVLYMNRDLGFSPGLLGMIWAVGGVSSVHGDGATSHTFEKCNAQPASPVQFRVGATFSSRGRRPEPQSSQRSGRFHTPAVPRAALGTATSLRAEPYGSAGHLASRSRFGIATDPRYKKIAKDGVSPGIVNCY